MTRTERIDEIDAQIAALRLERKGLVQGDLAERAAFKIGDLIQWRPGKRLRRGKVTGYEQWGREIAYVVQSIRSDGGDGACCSVYPYHAPERAA